MKSWKQIGVIATLLLQWLPAFADDVITTFMSPIASYQSAQDLSSEALTDDGISSPFVSYLFQQNYAGDVLANGGAVSSLVSYQYPNRLDTEILTSGGIMSPIGSYQYYEWPGGGILNLQSSPVVSYYYDGGVLSAAVAVQGQVLDASTGQPLAGALVQLGANSTTSDAQGAYRFASVMPGLYPLVASKTGYVDANETVSVAPVSSPTRILSLQPASSPGSAPRVTGITSKYTGFRYYLDGVGFNVNFTATVDWGGTSTEKWTPKFRPVAKLDFSGSAGHERTAEL